MKKLIPSFLKELDRHFLLNHPLLWISKIHYVLFFGLFFWLLSAVMGSIIPLNLQSTHDLGLWNFLFSILAIVAFCFWIYYNVIFNIEKQFGKRHWTDVYKLFFIYAFCCFIFFGFSIPFALVYNSRVADFVTDRELIEDINTLNTAEPYLVNDLNNYSFSRDTTTNKSYYNINDCVNFGSYTPWEIKYDTIRFRNLLSDYQLHKQYQSIKSEGAIKEILSKQYAIQQKYGLERNITLNYVDNVYNRYIGLCQKSPIEYDYMYSGSDNNHKYDLEYCMRNISEAKFSALYVWKSEYLLFMMYLCFYLSVLLLLFKMVNWKQYLVTAIACILIPIILFIFTQLLPYTIWDSMDRNDFYLLLIVLTMLVAIGFSIKSFFSNKRFWAFGNICAQISYAVLPILPLLILVIIKDSTLTFFNQDITAIPAAYDNINIVGSEAFANNYYNTTEFLFSQLLANYWREQFMLWQSICLFGGIILFIVIWLPLFNKLFVKQLSLPRKS